MRYDRVLAIVIDSIGVGSAPDAEKYRSAGADTLGHMAEYFVGEMGRPLELPNLVRLGLAGTHPDGLAGIEPPSEPAGAFGRMQVVSFGNDSLDGHWEMMCLPARFHVDYFPEGFPTELLAKLETFSGRKIIVNLPYSGTEVIRDWGEQQMRTGELIVYTSGDSVLQIAAHEDVIPVEELYRICEYARTLVNGPEITLGRIIARPYVGADRDHFVRTANRRDYGLRPTGPTAITKLQDAGYDTIAVGKTFDLFCGQGFDRSFHNESNANGMDHVDAVMAEDWTGLTFVNLVDFDAKFGHRRNARGDGEELELFDHRLGRVLDAMHDDDLLMISADHGNDPTYTGTDHTRELVPLIVWSPSMGAAGTDLGLRRTCSDMGATILENFDVAYEVGASFLAQVS